MMPFTAAKLGAVQGSAIVIVGERWGAESCPVVLAFRQERWGAESALPMGARGSDSDSGNHGSNPGPPAKTHFWPIQFLVGGLLLVEIGRPPRRSVISPADTRNLSPARIADQARQQARRLRAHPAARV